MFNTQPETYHVFLLSTKAGGLGINLATADTVRLDANGGLAYMQSGLEGLSRLCKCVVSDKSLHGSVNLMGIAQPC